MYCVVTIGERLEQWKQDCCERVERWSVVTGENLGDLSSDGDW